MEIALIVICLCCSAFFSASETALTSANRIRLKNLADNGSKAAARTLKIIQRYDKAVTTILIGNNIVNIGCSSLATILTIRLMTEAFNETIGNQYGSLVSTIVTTLVVLTFGEVMPKSIAKDHSESIAMGVSGIITFLMFLLTPLSALFIGLNKLAAKIFRSKKSVSVTEEELMAIIDEIEDEGVLEQQESNLVRSALQFDEITVDEIITPRVRVVAVEVSESADNIYKMFLGEQYSRMPVYEKTLDNIVGVINQKDFFKAYDAEGNDLSIDSLVQETIYFPCMLKISEVLRTMQKKKTHMAVVLDQHGGTLGIVTMEDLLEELVGEIWDESDEVKSPITVLSDRTFLAYGEVSLNSFRRFLDSRDIDVNIESEAHTVAGWTLELFGSIPHENDSAQTEDFKVTVVEINDLLVNKVKIELIEKSEEED